MPNTIKRLYTNSPSNTGIDTLYTTPSNTKTIVKNIVLVNTTGTEANVTVNLVPVGGTPQNSNQLISAYKVQQHDTVVIDVSLVLESGDSLRAQQGTAGAVTLHVSGVEVS